MPDCDAVSVSIAQFNLIQLFVYFSKFS